MPASQKHMPITRAGAKLADSTRLVRRLREHTRTMDRDQFDTFFADFDRFQAMVHETYGSVDDLAIKRALDDLARSRKEAPNGGRSPGRTRRQREAERSAANQNAGCPIRLHAFKPPDQTALVRGYRLFAEHVDDMHAAGCKVPSTRAGRHRFLMDELGCWAYGGLCQFVPPRTDGARALLTTMVPDLLFASVDRILPADLLARLDPAVLDRWNEVSRQLAMDARRKLVLTFDAARAAVDARLKAEAADHRSLDTFFEGGLLTR